MFEGVIFYADTIYCEVVWIRGIEWRSATVDDPDNTHYHIFYARFICPTFMHLTYRLERGADTAKAKIEDMRWGLPQMLIHPEEDVDVEWLRLAVINKWFENDEELLADIENPSTFDLGPVFNEIFGDR